MAKAEATLEWDIYLLAGVGSTPGIFNDCKRELERRFGIIGRHPVIRELFPYGDHTQKLGRQLLEVRGDLSRLQGAAQFGGRAAAEQIRRLSAGHPVLLIGHSGGGVAAYRAAAILYAKGAIPDFRVIQVGSPKVPICSEYRDRISYYVAVDETGKLKDPITRLGSWGGWSRSRLGLWSWSKQKYAPGRIGTITVLGGHPHYFRHREPYVHPELGSNLVRTLNTIMEKTELDY
ncbi:hypothetical protein BG53_00355 [Paenibacillus darwinianus]|uniref:Fungal lipase-like domain-containing protein n=1 Tax=Paenibacillus darwinianus TaxID=1380763 RepID=A0A9W5S1G0_9BACL|nr:hypothetical protein [Paenibacillus darwinianus]EXX88466.1 hypothetical protein BG52_02020 [Paenibacillus darwinianus]EXX89286.1 hypothetical protein BG53_00355 [Paenibacillus darwinianus]EXX90002.1 hypothetical protein CH50_00440 [Paenibacillus darwinianus]